MSLEVTWLPEREDLEEHSEELKEGGVAFMNGYGEGDGSDRVTCVTLHEGVAQVVLGKVTVWEIEGGMHIYIEDAERLALLPVGVPYAGRVISDDGYVALFFARNLGEGPPQYPDMHPAWN